MPRYAADDFMSATDFRNAIADLGFPSAYAAAPALGVSVSQAQRYAAHGRVPRTMQRLIQCYRRHGVPAEYCNNS